MLNANERSRFVRFGETLRIAAEGLNGIVNSKLEDESRAHSVTAHPTK